jgi:4-carboxymuconolactone decarboxylase
MFELTSRDQELVAIGAALASNCIPCVERVIPRARSAGLTDEAIRAAIRHADAVRQVPARAVLEAALQQLPAAAGAGPAPAGSEPSMCMGANAGPASESGPRDCGAAARRNPCCGAPGAR